MQINIQTSIKKKILFNQKNQFWQKKKKKNLAKQAIKTQDKETLRSHVRQ